MARLTDTARRLMEFDAKGMASLALWVLRRRDGVPPGATAVPYSGAQTAIMAMWLFAMVVELVGLEIVLRALDAPVALRTAILVIDAYSVLVVLAVIAACITRPHVVSPDELRLRYGAFFDLRIPRALITGVRRVRNFDENGLITVDGDVLALAVASQTTVVVELAEPITAVRPLGARVRVRTVRFYADDPGAVLAALRPAPEPGLEDTAA
ncbi:hypothetical protein [Thermomonospora amylolytica]|uniref:hypothetical protein n=1 Tax=Thermomonospora amylolytica TaxID=1411117 RepID=UPI000E6C8A1B|nr:hypothetical protein [Thermomonospora amylolytica]